MRRPPNARDPAEVELVNGFTSDHADLPHLLALQTCYVKAVHPVHGSDVWLVAFVWGLWVAEEIERADRIWEDFVLRRPEQRAKGWRQEGAGRPCGPGNAIAQPR